MTTAEFIWLMIGCYLLGAVINIGVVGYWMGRDDDGDFADSAIFIVVATLLWPVMFVFGLPGWGCYELFHACWNWGKRKHDMELTRKTAKEAPTFPQVDYSRSEVRKS